MLACQFAVLTVGLGCGHAKPMTSVQEGALRASSSGIDDSCRDLQTPAVETAPDLTSDDVQAITQAVSRVSQYPVVGIQRAEATNLVARHGDNAFDVRVRANTSCDSEAGYSLLVVREGKAWRVLDERHAWKTIYD